ncbi:MAG: gliding motility protein GldC, partial [Saprospiraceae bacterium]|nr:gliding motility protein GldC [Saprospiraceae bacterium]
MLVSFFDKASKDTLKIDLWTKEMQVAEMDRFIYHSIKAMADTYYKSTGNRQLASAMQQFATYFGEEAEIIPRQES